MLTPPATRVRISIATAQSVEAIFLIDCDDRSRNTAYSASRTCSAAQAKARSVHRQYLATYGKAAGTFPLLRLRPWNWNEPFYQDFEGAQVYDAIERVRLTHSG